MVFTTLELQRLTWVGGLAVLMAHSVGCQVVGGFEEFSASTGASSDSGIEGGTDSLVPDVGARTDVEGVESARTEPDAPPDSGSSCRNEQAPGKAGPKMAQIVRADGRCFWIDESEVTVGQYEEFLGSEPKQMTGSCEWNTSFASGCEQSDGGADAASADGTLPITCVDWCDAKAYCEWAGKTLCVGKFTASGDPTQSYWYAACAGKDLTTFPYGDNYDNTVCNGADRPGNGCPDSCAALPANQQSACANAQGVLNLSGNAAEWVDECNNNSGENDECHVRGGSFRESNSSLGCGTTTRLARSKRADYVGFRCCAGDIL